MKLFVSKLHAKEIGLVLGLLFFSGCSATVPSVDFYRIAPVSIQKHEGVCTKSLKVHKAQSGSVFMSSKMGYGVDRYKQHTYTQAQWSEAPDRAISDAMVYLLQENGLFESVHSYKSRAATELVLELTLDEFMQYFDAKYEHSHAKVKITMTLLEDATNKAIASKTFFSHKEVGSLDAQGGVAALNEALGEVFAQSFVWMSEACR